MNNFPTGFLDFHFKIKEDLGFGALSVEVFFPQ